MREGLETRWRCEAPALMSQSTSENTGQGCCCCGNDAVEIESNSVFVTAQ